MSDKIKKYLEKYGFNPLVETRNSLNHVYLDKSIELNKDNLEYLRKLSKKGVNMCFDVDPKDKGKRILAYHAESDCYFICKSEAEFNSYADGEDVADVTDIECHEEEYKKRKGLE